MTTSNPSSDPKERFSQRVENYVKARPRYPREVIDHLHEHIGLEPTWQIVDLGAGTGISSELFLSNGNPVTAVEPNAAMRTAAEQSLRGLAIFKTIAASAEATTLPDAFADLVVAAQAFHWFDPIKTKQEIRRILRPQGWLLLMWNNRLLGTTPFLEAYEKLLLDFGTDYLKVRHNNTGEPELKKFFAPNNYKIATFPNNQVLDFDGLRSRLLSSSYIPHKDDPRHEQMLARVGEMFDRHNVDGHVTIEYRTELFYGQMH